MEHTGCEVIVINCADRRFSDIVCLFQNTADHLPVPCRLQIGSYTCGNYFLGLLERLARDPLPESLGGYDLVIPIFAEGQLDKFRSYTESPAVRGAKNIVVNDFGMLRQFSSKQRVRLGRLLFRDYRDHRYPAHEENLGLKSEALTAALQELEYGISAIENDILSADYKARSEALEVYYHFPYRQVSCAHICEFASIGKTVENKFVPDDSCGFQCFDVRIRHGDEYLKIGRNIFDIVPKNWLFNIKRPRIIYTPGW